MNKARHARRQALLERCDVSAIERDVQAAINTLEAATDFAPDSEAENALAALGSFVGIAVLVMRRSSPAVVAGAARDFQIHAHLHGIPVLATTTEENAS